MKLLLKQFIVAVHLPFFDHLFIRDFNKKAVLHAAEVTINITSTVYKIKIIK